MVDPQMQEERDGLLIGLAQRCGGIEAMLDSLFSFLKRKTDFYHVQKEGDRIGFPAGVAEKMVLEALRKYQSDGVAAMPDQKALQERATRLQGDRAEPPPTRTNPSTKTPTESAGKAQEGQKKKPSREEVCPPSVGGGGGWVITVQGGGEGTQPC